MATVLVVEDKRKLRGAGPVLPGAGRVRGAVGRLRCGGDCHGGQRVTGLVVLDLGLPDVPGETVARELRCAAPMPILMLTAKSAEEDRIRGLELGADDYVTKPFSARELVLRAQPILRRGGQATAQGEFPLASA